jgi:uncharacterized protein with PIN domain
MILSEYYETIKKVKLDIKNMRCPNCKAELHGIHEVKVRYTKELGGFTECKNCYSYK